MSTIRLAAPLLAALALVACGGGGGTSVSATPPDPVDPDPGTPDPDPDPPGPNAVPILTEVPYQQTRHSINDASHAPVIGYGPAGLRWTIIGMSPFRGVTAATIHHPPGYEIAYGVAHNEGIDSVGRTREQVEQRDREAADELQRYVRFFQDDLAPAFDEPPIVRLDAGNPEWAALAVAVVQAVNQVLPEGRRMVFDWSGRENAIQDGEIGITFRPRDQWPTPGTGRTVGRTEYPVLYWVPGDRSASEYGAQVWIDTDFMRRSSPRHARAVIAHEVMHALGLTVHLDSGLFPRTILQAVINTDLNTPEQSLYAVDRLGLFAIHNDLGPDDLDDWTRDAVRIEAYMLGEDSSQFGVQTINGLTTAWATIRENPYDFGEWAEAIDLGSATWGGRFVGLTPQIASVSGDATLRINLAELDGTLTFTDLETWGAGQPLGADGTGIIWGDGDLRYAVDVQGNIFVQTGGDSGTVSGAFGGSNFGTMGGVLERSDLEGAFAGRQE